MVVLVVVVLVVLGLVVIGSVLVLLQGPDAAGRRGKPDEDVLDILDPADVAEIDELLGRADAEERAIHDSLLCTRLDLLLARRVPVRRVTSAAIAGAATVGFADGTAITVASRRAAEAGVLLMWANQQRVLLHHYCRQDDSVVLTFGRPGRDEALQVVALGLDQPQ